MHHFTTEIRVTLELQVELHLESSILVPRYDRR